MNIELCGHYAFMSWYVQPATAPVSYRDYLKHELLWHGCITHVICSLKISHPSPHASEHFSVIGYATFSSVPHSQ